MERTWRPERGIDSTDSLEGNWTLQLLEGSAFNGWTAVDPAKMFLGFFTSAFGNALGMKLDGTPIVEFLPGGRARSITKLRFDSLIGASTDELLVECDVELPRRNWLRQPWGLRGPRRRHAAQVEYDGGSRMV